jgi:RNA polymerase sigma-70 factor (ECF subfamily)
MTYSDSEIVDLIKQGQVDRYSDLVQRYERYVFSIVTRYVNAEHVSDVAQEAFLRAFRDLAQLRGRDSFKGWIRIIAIRSSYDLLRKQKSIPEFVPVSADEYERNNRRVSEAIDNYEQELTRLEAAEILRAIFSKLGPKERMVLVLLYFEGHSIEEVATILGWSKANVKIRAYRARHKAQKVAMTFTMESA